MRLAHAELLFRAPCSTSRPPGTMGLNPHISNCWLAGALLLTGVGSASIRATERVAHLTKQQLIAEHICCRWQQLRAQVRLGVLEDETAQPDAALTKVEAPKAAYNTKMSAQSVADSSCSIIRGERRRLRLAAPLLHHTAASTADT